MQVIFKYDNTKYEKTEKTDATVSRIFHKREHLVMHF